MLEGTDTIVLDLETANSADDLESGWNDKRALGLSIGCYFDYRDGHCHWFDVHTLHSVMVHLVEREAFMVSFNGLTFDFALMRAILRDRADHQAPGDLLEATRLRQLCDQFKVQAGHGYDILQALWYQDPPGRFKRGLYSLDAVATANGLPAKTGTGTMAPRWWQQGLIAQVLEYCQWDVLLTKALFEHIIMNNGWLKRGDGELIQVPAPLLRHPTPPEVAHATD